MKGEGGGREVAGCVGAEGGQSGTERGGGIMWRRVWGGGGGGGGMLWGGGAMRVWLIVLHEEGRVAWLGTELLITLKLMPTAADASNFISKPRIYIEPGHFQPQVTLLNIQKDLIVPCIHGTTQSIR